MRGWPVLSFFGRCRCATGSWHRQPRRATTAAVGISASWRVTRKYYAASFQPCDDVGTQAGLREERGQQAADHARSGRQHQPTQSKAAS